MTIHQLDLLLGKIPNATEQLMVTIVEKVRTYATKVKSTQDDNLLQNIIATMPSSTLDEFKKLLDEKKVNDQSFTRLLTRYFIPEAHTMSEMIETLSILIEVLEKTFMIQCVNALWTENGGGFFTFKSLKTMCDERATELVIMRKHGMLMTD